MPRNDSGGMVDVAEAEEAIAKMRIELQQEMMQGSFLFQLETCISVYIAEQEPYRNLTFVTSFAFL